MREEAAWQTTGPIRTLVVEGPLALRTERLAAARRREIGLQILTLPLLAARLAGGFARPASSADLAPAIEAALEEVPLATLGAMATLPGMRSALLRTLDRLWRAGVDLAEPPSAHPRLAELRAIDAAIRCSLPAGAMAPPDLAAAALGRISLAPRVLGEVRLQLAGTLDRFKASGDRKTIVVPQTWVHAAVAFDLDRPSERKYFGPVDRIRNLAISPDKRWIAAGGRLKGRPRREASDQG